MILSIASFLGFTLLVALIAWLATRKNVNSSDGYFLGGRSLTGPVIAGSLLLTNLSTEQIVGLNGAAFEEGVVVMAWETLAAIAMVLTAMFLLPRYLKGGITTVPQFLENRYDKMTKTWVSGLFLSGYVVVLLPIVLYSGALAVNTMFDVPTALGLVIPADVASTLNPTELLDLQREYDFIALWPTVISIAFIGVIYAVFGGLKAVAVSDSINAIGLLVGGLAIPLFGLIAIGDGSAMAGVDNLLTEFPGKFNAIGGSTASVPFATIFTGLMLVQMFYWGTNQAIIQRALGAKNLAEGQKGLLIASFLKILGPLMLVLPGIIAFYMSQHPESFTFFAGGDSIYKDQAYPLLVKQVLPAGMVGFFAAVLFGAILSSFNGALNSSVTIFGLDIYKAHINTEASEAKVVKIGQTFGVFLAIGGVCIAPFLIYAKGGLFNYLQEINGCYSIPIFTIIVVGYVTKRVPAIAAKVGLISGVVLYTISQFVLKPMVVEAGGTYPHFLHVMAILFVLNIVIMLVIGKLKPRDTDFVQEYTEQVDITPWKYLKPVSIIVVIIVVLTYIYFSPLADFLK
ncbi:solute:sodium symporter family transporter [Wenyingzhuangia marina]|uniref:Solute:Na+ symporter, SSS family n=1 Tax=Wenyingzhuangia marina TaxID=1195760 RepID=A0A1M5WDZ6_9FLAO|nr:solute:sodium symporter family transporter [Wenyingzhuangia marina]GGF81563.1 solute:sodium symporter family transporter [Wenyingzhuangia marina]SHH85722.1 solute:Na+ symporter, SSS family [Wenyingzhuangia marina]